MVEQTTAANQALSYEAEQLAHLIQRFRIAGSGGRPAIARAA
jgi:hypothetical protein